MEYTIDTSKPVNLNWSASGDERIIQNVFNLINTFQYEIAYNRNKGINSNLLDKPKDVAAAYYVSEVFRIIPIYESRVTVKEVQLVGIDDGGNLQFKVVVDI